MRGIAGIIHLDSTPVPPEDVHTLIDAMAICPVDRMQTRCEGSAGFAHLVKIAVPEDRFEAQPLSGEANRFIFVTDAVLTNRDELSPVFGWSHADAAIRADSEFVRTAYEKWGESCVRKLEGTFALAAWHPAEQRLFAAVDALGMRPFYYWHQNGVLAFATTLRGLLSLPAVSNQLNDEVFAEGFVGLGRVMEETLYRDIRRIPRGSILHATPAGLRTTRYWYPKIGQELRLRSNGEYQEAFRAEFTRAVQGSLRSSGEVGLLLSGGLDSSSIAACAGRLLADQGKTLRAFHLLPTDKSRFTGELRELDESAYVEALREISPHIDFQFYTQPAQSLLTETEQAEFFSDEQVPHHGLPVRADPLWQDFSRQHGVSLMLNGGGGNTLVSMETIGSGYLGHLAATGRWLTLAQEIRGLHRLKGTPWRTLARTTLEQAGWHRPHQAMPLSPRLQLLHPDLRRRSHVEEHLRERQSRFSKLLVKDIHEAHTYCLTEGMAQHRGVSTAAISRTITRLQGSPMHDRRLNEFCLSLPLRQQLRQGNDRILLRETTKTMLPDKVRLRLTRGFPQPFHPQDFETNRTRIMARLEGISSSPRVSHYFDHQAVRHLMTRLGCPSPSPQDESTASSLLSWSLFCDWHQNRPIQKA